MQSSTYVNKFRTTNVTECQCGQVTSQRQTDRQSTALVNNGCSRVNDGEYRQAFAAKPAIWTHANQTMVPISMRSRLCLGDVKVSVSAVKCPTTDFSETKCLTLDVSVVKLNAQ